MHSSTPEPDKNSQIPAPPEDPPRRSQSCDDCGGDHYIAFCPKSKERSPTSRDKLVVNKWLCFTCLGRHNLRICRNTTTCRDCQGRHHSLLHCQDAPSGTTQRTTSTQQNPTPSASLKTTREAGVSLAGPVSRLPRSTTSNASSDYPVSQWPRLTSTPPVVLLATAQLLGDYNNSFSSKVKALIDPTSELSFMSQRTVNLLHLTRKHESILISGIGGVSSDRTRGLFHITLGSIYSNTTTISVQCYILPQLTSWLPHTTLSRTPWLHLTNVNLADPTYFEPGPIDIILGADSYGSFIQPRIFRQPSGKLIAQETLFGWIILGPVSQGSPLQVTSVHASMNDHLLEVLTKFWTLEEVSSKSLLE